MGTTDEALTGQSFKERVKHSVFFDGADSLALYKLMTPPQVVIGVGVLASAFLSSIVSLMLGALLVLPPLVRVLLRACGCLRNPHMENVARGRLTARLDGDFCVFLIGARSNATWKFTSSFKWLGQSFVGMIRELEAAPESVGFLGAENYVGVNMQRGSHTMVVMYWRSYDHLVRWAQDTDSAHYPGWVKLMRMGRESPELGFWHEAYRVAEGQYESIYNNCPPMGLGNAGALVPATGRFVSSRGRAGVTDGSDLPKVVAEEMAPEKEELRKST